MSPQTHRVAQGGRIDRSAPLAFTFNGVPCEGYRGDSLASALLANGVRIVGRSFKYHRPRGIFGAGAEEPNALIRVGEGDRAEPNLKATRIELYDGLVAQSQNHWPSLEFDVGALNDVASRLLPAGFYYKTFMWPGSWWRLYEHFIRKAAGLGRAPVEPDIDHYDRRYAFCDVLVVGAGPAGLMAARTAARSGARVVVADEAPALGGSLLACASSIDGGEPIEFLSRIGEELASRPNVRVLSRTNVFGYYDDNMIVAVEHRADHVPAPAAHCARQRVWWIRAKEVVLATGAIERPLAFEANDRSGVMLASAARTYALQYGVRPGRRAVVFTNNDSAYEAIEPLRNAGTEVAAVVDARDGGPGGDATGLLQRLGVELVTGSVVTRSFGTTVDAVEVRTLSVNGASVGGDHRRLECDLVCISGGWSPTVHLFSQSQGRLRFDAERVAFVPGESAQHERSTGAARGLEHLSECLADGIAAGAEAARAAGYEAGTEPTCPAVEEWRNTAPTRALWAVPLPAGRRGKRFVDFQNDVTVADIELAAREGYTSVEHLKRYTTLGMGTDQGRTSNVNGLAVLAATLGTEISALGTTTFRPPYSPVALGAIAGREVGANQTPIRRTPMHDWHAAHGARFVTVGPWMRAQYYPRSGESMMDAINREALQVRRSVGIVDVSTLGKIEVRGRDAGEFLHRVYINRIRNLRVGRCRYAFMLREDGFVLDDGTVTRMRDDEYYLTTGTGHAGPVMSHLERYAQTIWPDSRRAPHLGHRSVGRRRGGRTARARPARGGVRRHRRLRRRAAVHGLHGSDGRRRAGAHHPDDVLRRTGLRGALSGRLWRFRVGGAARGRQAVRRRDLRHRSARGAAHREGARGPERAERTDHSRRFRLRSDGEGRGLHRPPLTRTVPCERTAAQDLRRTRLGERRGSSAWRPTGVESDRAEAGADARSRDVELLQPCAAAVHRARADRGCGGLEGQSALRRVAAHFELRSGPGHRSRVRRPGEPAAEGVSGKGNSLSNLTAYKTIKSAD